MKNNKSLRLVYLTRFFAVILFGLAMSVSAADKDNGRRLIEVKKCASCHGADLNSPTSIEYPKLAGQPADYLLHAMLAYQRKDNRLIGRNQGTMVKEMTGISRAELEDIAAYIASLPTGLVTKR